MQQKAESFKGKFVLKLVKMLLVEDGGINPQPLGRAISAPTRRSTP